MQFHLLRMAPHIIADIQGIIYFTITFPPLIISQKKNLLQNNQLRHFRYTSRMIRSAVSVHSPESYCSLRQFDGECTANPRRLQYDSTETALQTEKFLNRLKNFCSLATPQRMR